MEEEQNNKPGNQEVAPVKLSIGATVAIVIGLTVMLFILVFTVKGCSVKKNVSYEQPSESAVVETSESLTTGVPETTESVENTTEFEGSDFAPVEDPTYENNTGSNEEQSGVGSNPEFVEVADPVMSDLRTAYGMVIGKHIYKKDSSYIYGVSISVIVNEQSVSAQYFCPRKTYDELSSGDSLNVTYQVDSNGSVSIYSISRD